MPQRPSKSCAPYSPDGGDLDLPADFGDYKVAALPIIASFCQKLGVTRTVNRQIDSPENISSGQPFVSRLPAVYNEEQRAIDAAFEAESWTPVGVLAQNEDLTLGI